MSAPFLPAEGEFQSVGNVFKYATKTWTPTLLNAEAAGVAADSVTAVIPIFSIDQPNTWVKEILTHVDCAFAAAVDLSIGDTDDADGWAVVLGIAATVVAAAATPYWKSSAAVNTSVLAALVPVYAGGGKVYSDTTKGIEMTWIKAGSTAATEVGSITVVAVYTVLPSAMPI